MAPFIRSRSSPDSSRRRNRMRGLHMVTKRLTWPSANPQPPLLSASIHRMASKALPRCMMRSVSRASSHSTKSYGNMLAMNRISATAVENHADDDEESEPVRRYRLHRASDMSLAASVASTASLELRERIDDVENFSPSSNDFESANQAHGLLPSLRRFATPIEESPGLENWAGFLDRLFQPAACSSSTRRLSQSELVSPLTTEPASDSASPVSDNEPICFVETAQPVAIARGASLVKLRGHMGGYRRDAIGNAAMRDSGIGEHLLTPASVHSDAFPGSMLQHDTLPYQSYSGPFDPFTKHKAVLPSLVESASTPSPAPFAPVRPNEMSWLELEANETEVPAGRQMTVLSNEHVHQPMLCTSLHRQSLESVVEQSATESKPIQTKPERPGRPEITRNDESGVLERKVTGTRASRVIMNTAFPIFSKVTKSKSTKRQSRKLTKRNPLQPIQNSVNEIPAQVVSLDKHASTPRSVVTQSLPPQQPYKRPQLSHDRNSGVLTRKLTDAKTERVVMIDSYPQFARVSAPAITPPTVAANSTRPRPRVTIPTIQISRVRSGRIARVPSKATRQRVGNAPATTSLPATDPKPVRMRDDGGYRPYRAPTPNPTPSPAEMMVDTPTLRALTGEVEKITEDSQQRQTQLLSEIEALCNGMQVAEHERRKAERKNQLKLVKRIEKLCDRLEALNMEETAKALRGDVNGMVVCWQLQADLKIEIDTLCKGLA